ncbi:MAG: hypothetical protein ABIR32_23000 [Ilumatobacteraceae bacterium]
MRTGPHPLLAILDAAADGRFPAADGGVIYSPAFDDEREAVIGFTGHAVIASRLGSDRFADLQPDGFGAAYSPALLLRLAEGGTVGDIDVMLVGRGTGIGSAIDRTDRWDDHNRARFARQLRRDVDVYGDERGFFTIGTGLAGRRELSIEIVDTLHGSGVGRTMITESLAALPAGELLYAGIAPGNARSLRSFLASGFVPIGSEVVITPFTPNTYR